MAVLDPHGQLTVGELTGGLSLAEFLEADGLVFVFDVGVRQKHAQGGTSRVHWEIDQLHLLC